MGDSFSSVERNPSFLQNVSVCHHQPFAWFQWFSWSVFCTPSCSLLFEAVLPHSLCSLAYSFWQRVNLFCLLSATDDLHDVFHLQIGSSSLWRVGLASAGSASRWLVGCVNVGKLLLCPAVLYSEVGLLLVPASRSMERIQWISPRHVASSKSSRNLSCLQGYYFLGPILVLLSFTPHTLPISDPCTCVRPEVFRQRILVVVLFRLASSWRQLQLMLQFVQGPLKREKTLFTLLSCYYSSSVKP